MISTGHIAPDFNFTNNDGENIKLSDFRGKKVVLYFYPKDDTPGCTKEACGFRDDYDEILETGAVVIGISGDNDKSHEKFRLKYNLPFFLASDPEHIVSDAYGTWGLKKMLGKSYMGIIRSTYIIDENGVITKVFPKVTPEGHSREVLNALKE